MRASAGCSGPRARCSRRRSTCSRTSSCGSSGGRRRRNNVGLRYRRGAACCAPTVCRRDFLGAFAVGVAGIFVRRWPAPDRFVERWLWAMGQPVHVMVFASSEQEGLDACAAALAELGRVESRLTLFDTASDLCELTRRAGRTSLRADDDLRAVLAQAGAFKRLTGGAFDVAVEPLMRVWGFHRPRVSAPTAAELAEAREAVRAAVVELDGDVARLPSAHTQLDFGSIGVGYGIDPALAVPPGRAARRAFSDVSGD